jgi:hypothetical protein
MKIDNNKSYRKYIILENQKNLNGIEKQVGIDETKGG